MPIGPWPNFDACVAQNGDKISPEGFCAWLDRKLNGSAALTQEWQAKMSQAGSTRVVLGVEIFGAGTWTDSDGVEHEWTRDQLTKLVANSSGDDHTISIKAGHTSDKFNTDLAEALGVPEALLTGEGPTGGGQIALGHVAKLQRIEDKLIADFAGVPEPLANLIESGAFQGVSVEIEMVDGDPNKPMLTAVALLGVEEPAVESLAGLEAAKVFGKVRDNAHRYSFLVAVPQSSDEAGAWQAFKAFWAKLKSSPTKTAKAAFARNIEDRFKAISWLSADLGLPEDAPLVDVLAQLQQLLTAARAPAQDAAPMAKMTAKAASDLYHTIEERLRPVKWLAQDLGLAENAPLADVIARLEELQAGQPGEEETTMTTQGTDKRFVEHGPEMMAVLAELGLGEDATTDMVVAAIQDLKAKAAAGGETEEARLAREKAALEAASGPEMAGVKTELAEVKAELATARHEKLVLTYTRQAVSWKGIQGKPDDFGAELAKLHEDAGEDVAKRLAESYARMSSAATDGAAPITRPIGTARGAPTEETDPFEKEMWDYAEKNNLTPAQASAHFQKTQPQAWTAYYRRAKQNQVPVDVPVPETA